MLPKPNKDITKIIENLHFSTDADSAELSPWIEIDAGRFMPRRVRGSYLGRALG
jgi:hypothetical protein